MSSKVDGHTHGVGCYGWHRGHYQCALDEIKRLNDALSSAWDSLNELRGDAKEAEDRAFKALDRPAPETRVSHAVTCKKFPDPHDERDPVGPCTCGAESKPTREHVEREDCWCHPTLDYTDPETGVQHWIHHEPM